MYLDLFNNLPDPFLPLSVNDDRKNGDLVFLPFRQFFKQTISSLQESHRNPEEQNNRFASARGKGNGSAIQCLQVKGGFFFCREPLDTERGQDGQSEGEMEAAPQVREADAMKKEAIQSAVSRGDNFFFIAILLIWPVTSY